MQGKSSSALVYRYLKDYTYLLDFIFTYHQRNITRAVDVKDKRIRHKGAKDRFRAKFQIGILGNFF